MENGNENKKELTFEEVQKIIDGQIAKIEEEKSKGQNNNPNNNEKVYVPPKKNGLKMFFKRIFSIK